MRTRRVHTEAKEKEKCVILKVIEAAKALAIGAICVGRVKPERFMSIALKAQLNKPSKSVFNRRLLAIQL